MTDSLSADLRAARPAVTWDRPERAPKDAVTERVWIGADPNGLGFEVAVAAWSGAGAPTQEALRRLHAGRLRNRAVPLCVAVYDTQGRAWIFGPAASAPPFGPIRSGQAVRVLQAALDERTGSAARSRVLQARDAFETAEIPGFDPQGLFAIRELTYGVPRRPDWADACDRSRALLATSPRGNDLIRGLGFESRSIAGNALLLTVGAEPPRAIAILLRDDESFDAESSRFAKSPIYHGLEIARQNNVRWLVVTRGPQLRLYPTSPDVGVGRRGATQTYFGLDLALLDDEHAGYLELAFSAGALALGGSVDDLLEASRDYAVSLGERLRERIYEKVVDPLSTAIARSLGVDGALDERRLALAYRLTLRILFRLLFQAYAEDTRLLPLHRNDRYTKASLKELARDLAEHPDRPQDVRSTSLWDGLRQVWRVIDTGDEAWGVPAYNGGLFGSDADLHPDGAAIARLELRNDALGPVLAGLLVDVASDEIRGPVDFRSLDVRDFGTIYEGLLESGLSVAEDDLTDDSLVWRPARPGEQIDARKGTPYFHTKSGERKATGSYFTKPFVVEHLLEQALDPALDLHLEKVAGLVGKGDQVGAARLLFDFRVADLAMGSGHFLVAAIGHIEAKFGAFLERNPIPGVERELLELRDGAQVALRRVGVDEAEIDRSALIGRQIARRCIYGLDINDLAVELARLAIWVRTFVPGLPMSSLDHQLVCANSLTGIGAVDEAVEALDPGAQTGALTFSGVAIKAGLDVARRVLEDAAALKESTSEEARAAQAAARQAIEIAEPARLLFDAAVAVRLGLMRPPVAFDADSIGRSAASPEVQAALAELALGHFPVRFPEVFLREPAGFDVILGNPPWEEVVVDEPRFWARHRPGLMAMPVQERDAVIADLRTIRADLVLEFEGHRVATNQMRNVLIRSFPLGQGDADLYKAFAWRFWRLVRDGGRLGVVLPKTAFSAAGLEQWRRMVLTEGTITNLTVVLNTGHWVFEGVEARYSIAFASLLKGLSEAKVQVAGIFGSREEYDSGVGTPAVLSRTTVLELTSAASIPMLSSQMAADTLSTMRRAPPLTDPANGSTRLVSEFHATNDRRFFDHARMDGSLAVYSGASFNLWEPDTGQVFAWADATIARRELMARMGRQTRLRSSAFFGLERDLGGQLPYERTRIAFRGVVRPTDSRTVITALVPPRTILTNIAPYILLPVGSEIQEAFLLGVMNSVPFDWYARKFIETQMNFHFVSAFPIPTARKSPLGRRCIEIAGRLSAVDPRFGPWATAVGVATGSAEEPRERADLIAELDAVVAHLYALSRDQVQHIFTTFHRGWSYTDRLARVLAHFDRLLAANG